MLPPEWGDTGRLFDCSGGAGPWILTVSVRAVVPPAAVRRHIDPGDAASIGASRRLGRSNGPFKARTPARPDGANLNPPAPAAGGFSFGPAKRALALSAGCPGSPLRQVRLAGVDHRRV